MENFFGILTLFMTAIALAIDAFIVSITCGIGCKGGRKCAVKTALKAGIAFGTFQAGMTFLGWTLGLTFKDLISSIDHWIAFGILVIIGLKMIKDSFEEEEKGLVLDSLKLVIVLAVATSIDALVVGISYSLVNMDLYTIAIGSAIIGIVSLVLCIIGVWIGVKFKNKFKHKEKLNIIGGSILILIGIKTLVEHIL